MGVLDASTSPPKERYAVSRDNIIKLIQPGNVDDQLTEILRNGARALLAQAIEAEVADFLGEHADLKSADGHQRVVRHGHLPEREVMTGIGAVAVRQPRVRDREADATDPLPEGYLHRRLLRGSGGAARQGCRRVVGHRDQPPEGRLA